MLWYCTNSKTFVNYSQMGGGGSPCPHLVSTVAPSCVMSRYLATLAVTLGYFPGL